MVCCANESLLELQLTKMETGAETDDDKSGKWGGGFGLMNIRLPGSMIASPNKSSPPISSCRRDPCPGARRF